MKAVNFVALEGGTQVGISSHTEIDLVLLFSCIDSIVTPLFAERGPVLLRERSPLMPGESLGFFLVMSLNPQVPIFP